MKKLWLELNSPVGKISVYIKKKLRGNASGLYNQYKGEILIERSTPDTMMMTLIHELMHVALDSFSGHVKSCLLGGKRRTISKREEQVVGLIEPFLYDVLTRNKLLRFPTAPKYKKSK